MDQYKITAEEFARVSIARLATHPNSRSGVGEGGMRDTDLKKRFDAQGELFRKKFNALLVAFAMMGEGSLAASMPTGIKEEHTLWDMICDVVSERGAFASYLSVGEQSLLEALSALTTRDDEHDEALEQFIKKHNTDIAEVVAQMDEAFLAAEKRIAERVLRVETDVPCVYVTDGIGGASRVPIPLAQDARGGSVAMRDDLGAMFVGNAVQGGHAVNKAYLERILEAFVAKQGDQTIGGNLSISGDLYVTGSTYGTDVESLNVKDAVIVANADGVPLAELSGYVIRVSDSEAYGILYDPTEACVKIGLGSFDSEKKVFVYEAGQAQVLATRGKIADGNIPMWDGAAYQFVDSNLPVSEIADKAFVNTFFSQVYDKGYVDGYAAGLAEVEASYGNALVGVATGTDEVKISDVSPLSHPIKVTCDGERVVRYGKNLLDGRAEMVGAVSYKMAAGADRNYFGFSLVLSAGTYTIHAEGDPAAYNNNDYIYGVIIAKDGTFKSEAKVVVGANLRSVTFDAADGDVVHLYNAGTNNDKKDKSKEILSHYHYQVEVGDAATAYEPYVEPLEVAVVDGVAEVPSLSPTTIILGEGAIEAQYNRDINKAYTELVNAILALGGAMNV